MKKLFKISMLWQILIATILAVFVGLMMMGHADFALTYIKPFGTIFLNLLKFIVAPVVLLSIMDGVLSLRNIREVGSIGWKAIVFYLLTTLFAITLGLVVANFGKEWFPVLSTSNVKFKTAPPLDAMDTIVNIFPSNFVQPFSEGLMLQIIVIALLLSFGILMTGGEKGKMVTNIVSAFNTVIQKVMEIILKISPIGVFCLLCPVIAENGPSIVGSLAIVILVAYIAYVLHATIVYSALVKFLGKMSPMRFFKGMFPAMLFAYASSSSVGTIPINMNCLEKLGVRRSVFSFVIPLGATINMDGTAIYQGVCSIFIASCFGIDLTMGQMLTIILTATLASIGTAGVPGAGVVMLTMVLTSVNLPVEGIALVAGVDRIFDMGRTVLNITGDAACVVVVNEMERKKLGNAL